LGPATFGGFFLFPFPATSFATFEEKTYMKNGAENLFYLERDVYMSRNSSLTAAKKAKATSSTIAHLFVRELCIA